MQFNIEEDAGAHVALWVVPTNPANVPRISLSLNGGIELELEAHVVRPDFRTHGLHATGMVGFDLTEENVPGISTCSEFSIFDAVSGLLIYRRRHDNRSIEGRLFHLETRARRQPYVDRVFQDRFHMAYTSLEAMPAETVTTVLRIPYTTSLYASGRLPLDPIEDILRRQGFKVAMRLHDPVRELFDRLLMLTEPDTYADVLATLMPAAILSRLSSRLRSVPIRQLDEVGRIVSRLDNETQAYLSDPLTRQLIQAPAGQILPRDAAKLALTRIAEIDIVALEEDVDGFFEIASAVMGTEAPFIAPEASMPSAPAPSILRRQDWFVRLVRHDMAVYDAVVDAAASMEPSEA